MPGQMPGQKGAVRRTSVPGTQLKAWKPRWRPRRCTSTWMAAWKPSLFSAAPNRLPSGGSGGPCGAPAPRPPLPRSGHHPPRGSARLPPQGIEEGLPGGVPDQSGALTASNRAAACPGCSGACEAAGQCAVGDAHDDQELLCAPDLIGAGRCRISDTRAEGNVLGIRKGTAAAAH